MEWRWYRHGQNGLLMVVEVGSENDFLQARARRRQGADIKVGRVTADSEMEAKRLAEVAAYKDPPPVMTRELEEYMARRENA